MRNRVLSRVLAIALAVFLIVPFAGVAGAAAGATTITIFHTNDTHGRLEEDSSAGMGFAKIATYVKQYEATNPNTLLLDAGDTFHGTTVATLVRGESVADILNAVGYDAMTTGNHDYNYGYQRLVELAGMVDFPVLCANVHKADGSRLFTPYVINDVGGVKVAIFGLATPETTYKTHPKNVEGLTFADPVEEAKTVVAELEGKADVVIALAHLGMDAGSAVKSTDVAEEVPGIDLIVDGHSHTVLEQGKLVGDTLIVSAGEYDEYLGKVELTVEGGKVTAEKASLITKADSASVTGDQAVLEIVNVVKASQKEVLAEVIGKTAVKLEGAREMVRKQETNLGDLIADSMVYVSGADAAFANGGGIRATIDAGEITKGQVVTVLPFNNYIVTKKVSGADIKAALELGVSLYPALAGGFPQVSGMTYTFDPSKPVGQRIVAVTIGGKPVDENKSYVLACNDFMAAGGDGYTMFSDDAIANEFPALDEALITYVKAVGTVTRAVDGRILALQRVAYTVRPGDVLWRIAMIYGTTVGEIQKINNFTDADVLKVGQQIFLPVASLLKTDPAATGTYDVQAGDTLGEIAAEYGITWQVLQQMNGLTNPNLLYEGQRLAVPAK